ncbi:MAG: 3-isopropylmalate dehydratase large subunit [Anaerolineae bacterium]|nr:3-isopropylmalate dehydratase large subunit [Anaerolineae bacterium]
MSLTIAEKIISRAAGRIVRAGEIAVVRVDGVMATDATAPMAIQAFRQMGGRRVWNPLRVSLVIDHAAPAPNERAANLHTMMRQFAREQGCHFYDVGAGICHQLMVEHGHVRPGYLFLGADSHTPTYGALNAFAAGIGSTDLAGILLMGRTWLKVPPTIKVELHGRLPLGVTAKDLILFLVGQVGLEGANYQCVEFAGEAIAPLRLSQRMTLVNMASEMGAKAGVVEPIGLRLPYAFEPVFADAGATYARVLRFDVSRLTPHVALPHSPANAVPIAQVKGTKIQAGFIGSCTNARLDDLHQAAAVLRGRRLAPGTRLVIAPASRAVFNAALRDGTLATLSEAGATFISPGCGPCVGTHEGVPGDGEVVISSTNRNFQGRMGNPKAQIYLASPAVVAASVLAGEIAAPDDVGVSAGADDPLGDQVVLGDRLTEPDCVSSQEAYGDQAEPLDGAGSAPAFQPIVGCARVYDVDNIDTDRIIPGKYTKTLSAGELARHVLEDLDPGFAVRAQPGDILVVGHNFGCGSSREQAAVALKAAGVACVIGRSFARIFYRNAINVGLPLVELGEPHDIAPGHRLRIELEHGLVMNETTGQSFHAAPMPTMMTQILRAGGLIEYLKARHDSPQTITFAHA